MSQLLEDRITTKINPKLFRLNSLSLDFYPVDNGFGQLDFNLFGGSIHLIDYQPSNLILGSVIAGVTLIVPGLTDMIRNQGQLSRAQISRRNSNLGVHSAIYNFSDTKLGIHPQRGEELLDLIRSQGARINKFDRSPLVPNFTWEDRESPYYCVLDKDSDSYTVIMNPKNRRVRNFVNREINWEYISGADSPMDRRILIDKRK